MSKQTAPKEFNDANIRVAREFKAERDDLLKANQILQTLIGNRDKEVDRLHVEKAALVKTLKSASIQCGNVIYNCEQKPADNRRHLDSWCSVKGFIDTALRNAVVGGSREP